MVKLFLVEYPIDFLHTSLPKDKKNDFLYYHYKFILTKKSKQRKEKLKAKG